MKKLVLSGISAFVIFTSAFSQSQSCNTFTGTTGLSTYPDPSAEVAYSVAGGELTLTYTNASFWGDEFKWTFPNTIDISGVTAPKVTYDVEIVSITINGTGCSAVNYLPFGMSVTDDGNDYSTGSSSSGYYSTSYDAGSNTISTTDLAVDYTKIAAVSIKPASFSAVGCTPTSVTASIKIKNLCVGGTTTGLQTASSLVNSINVFPNPTLGNSNVELKLASVSNTKIVLKDMMGRNVLTIAEGSFSEMNKSFDTTNLQQGLYNIAVLVDGAVVKTEQLLVK